MLGGIFKQVYTSNRLSTSITMDQNLQKPSRPFLGMENNWLQSSGMLNCLTMRFVMKTQPQY